jgi:hypothetical protein
MKKKKMKLSFCSLFFFGFFCRLHQGNGGVHTDRDGAQTTSTAGNSGFVVSERVISRPSRETIHRFFDSSALSPTKKYAALIELSRTESTTLSEYDLLPLANITLYNMNTNTHEIIDQTAAWGSQVGAHLQWGKTDDELYYNILVANDSQCELRFRSSCEYTLRGIQFNLKTKKKTILSCPIYHVSSDGLKSISPNLFEISHAQKGYGIDWKNLNRRVDYSNGLFVNDLKSFQCSSFYSLEEIASHIGINTKETKVFPFHTKWSSNGEFILFVMRTIEKGVPKQSTAWSRSPITPRARVQHLFVLGGSKEKKKIVYLFSWASKPILRKDSSTDHCEEKVIRLRDGNHPNWVPDTLKITMNLETGDRDGTTIKKSLSTVLIDLTGFLSALQTPPSFPLYHQNFIFHSEIINNRGKENCFNDMNLSLLVPSGPLEEGKENKLAVVIIWPIGSGHPSIHPSGRYLLLDKYAKEINAISVQGDKTVKYSPISLIDIYCQEEYHLAQVQ